MLGLGLKVCTTEDKTAVVNAIASYNGVSRNPVRFKALAIAVLRQFRSYKVGQ